MQKKIIRQYYILSCLWSGVGLAFISAVYVSFLMKNGLNLFQVNMVNAVFFVSMFICEIPTGAFADIFGRKNSYIMACVIMCVSMIVYGLSHTFVGFLVAEILGAIGCDFCSGAFKAWFVDSLDHYGYTEDKCAIFCRNSYMSQASAGLGAVAGSYLYGLNPVLPWFASGAAMLLILVVACLIMKEDYFVKEKFSWRESYSKMRDMAVKSVRYGIEDKAVRFILVITGMQVFAAQALNMYWQPFFAGRGIGSGWFGLIFAGVMLMLIVGGLVISRMKVNGREKQLMIVMQMVMGTLAIAAALVPGTFCIVTLYLLHEIPRGASGPLRDSYLHKRIPSKERATIASFCEAAPDVGGALGLIVSGAIAQYCGIATAWVISGTILVLGAIWLGRNGKGKED